MKIRTDLVTNSSSSSFIVININSNILANFCIKNNIPENFFEILAEEIQEPYCCAPEMFKEKRHTLADTLLYCIDFACMVNTGNWDCEEIEHFSQKFCNVGNVPAEKVEALYRFIYDNKDEINNDPMLIARVMATEIATDGGGEGSYYELRAEQGKQLVAILDLWENIMSPLFDADEDDAAYELIDEIACGDADLWKIARQQNTIKEI